jgi:hypothetical protein
MGFHILKAFGIFWWRKEIPKPIVLKFNFVKEILHQLF